MDVNTKKKPFNKITKKSLIYTALILFILALILTISIKLIKFNKKKVKINLTYINKHKKEKEKTKKNKTNKANINNDKCYSLSSENSNIKFIHLIITRFIMEFSKEFNKIIYTEEYAKNGIRVMKKYLFPSLENQKCKDFTWVLMLGDKANKNHIKSLLNMNDYSFKYKIVYQKDLKKYMIKNSKDLDFLITTRIDYDDSIYYDAVNDARKQIDINKPIFLHGYNKGVYYFEENDKYYDYYNNFDNRGVMSIFISLILNLKKVNDTISIYDLGDHTYIKKTLLKKYKSFGIKELNYDPALFDESSQKFIYVRQNYSGAFDFTKKIPRISRPINFNLSSFYGK